MDDELDRLAAELDEEYEGRYLPDEREDEAWQRFDVRGALTPGWPPEFTDALVLVSYTGVGVFLAWFLGSIASIIGGVLIIAMLVTVVVLLVAQTIDFPYEFLEGPSQLLRNWMHIAWRETAQRLWATIAGCVIGVLAMTVWMTQLSPHARTAALIDSTATAIRAHREQAGALPGADLAEALGVTGEDPHALSAHLEGGVLADAWGQPLIYETEDGRFNIYSTGPDGENDAGAGDDIASLGFEPRDAGDRRREGGSNPLRDRFHRDGRRGSDG